jgi:glycosyltransferase involved in cell wall biosynthesis
MKLSLSMIVKASDDEALLLNRCLRSVSSFVDEINITITGENDMCERICKQYGANVSHFTWVNDFSKARNFNFSQATGDFILWLDADDILRGGEKLKETVEEMEKNHIDTVIFPYLYDFDSNGLCTVRHLKTRIVKNDGCVTWVESKKRP